MTAFSSLSTAVLLFVGAVVGQECPRGMQSLANGHYCINDRGCEMQGTGFKCFSGTCCIKSHTEGPYPICRGADEEAEMKNGLAKNCLEESCSDGYQCEYSHTYNNGQFVCCGRPPLVPVIPPSQYGVVKINPHTGGPLPCIAGNSCRKFPDTPNCVYSNRFEFKVCCSTSYC
ncbi:unnamed protein product [Anisakis simplex]|uniref:CC domain-containing protein n=1 Tax=Anisakis simplex TaxID=6269 RepID=A0A0M3JWN0_ANISI|nr:unnamed protein product [Anisakis simplex]